MLCDLHNVGYEEVKLLNKERSSIYGLNLPSTAKSNSKKGRILSGPIWNNWFSGLIFENRKTKFVTTFNALIIALKMLCIGHWCSYINVNVYKALLCMHCHFVACILLHKDDMLNNTWDWARHMIVNSGMWNIDLWDIYVQDTKQIPILSVVKSENWN